MGYGARKENVLYCLNALENVLTKLNTPRSPIEINQAVIAKKIIAQFSFLAHTLYPIKPIYHIFHKEIVHANSLQYQNVCRPKHLF